MELVQRLRRLEVRGHAQRGRDLGPVPQRAQEVVARDRRLVRAAVEGRIPTTHAPEEPQHLLLADAGRVLRLGRARGAAGRRREPEALQMELQRDRKRFQERRYPVRALDADFSPIQTGELDHISGRRRDTPKNAPAVPEAVVGRVRPED